MQLFPLHNGRTSLGFAVSFRVICGSFWCTHKEKWKFIFIFTFKVYLLQQQKQDAFNATANTDLEVISIHPRKKSLILSNFGSNDRRLPYLNMMMSPTKENL